MATVVAAEATAWLVAEAAVWSVEGAGVLGAGVLETARRDNPYPPKAPAPQPAVVSIPN